MEHRDNVERGATLLDEKRPGWYREIDTNRLSIEDDKHCMCGQLFPSYTAGLIEMGVAEANAVRYGFNLNASSYGYDQEQGENEFSKLRDFWISEINTRLAFDNEVAELELATV